MAEHKDKADEPKHAPAHPHAHAKAHGTAGVKIGDVVRVKARPGQPAATALYKVRDVSHDKGAIFASVENYPDPSAGVFGSFHIEDLEVAPHDELPEGPGGHPPPTPDQAKAAEAAAAHRLKVDEDAAKAIELENKKAAELQAAQRAELRKQRGHHE